MVRPLPPLARRRWAVAAVAAVALLLVGVTPAVVAAQSFQGGAGTVVVPEGETYDRVEGVAGTIIVRGTVTGSVSGAAGTVHVAETGTVEGDVSVAAGTVRVDGRVGGTLDAAAGSVQVSETGSVDGDVDVGAGFVSLDGRVGGDVRAGAETLVLGPTANVAGDVRYDAGTFTRAPGATVGGTVERDAGIGRGGGPGPGPEFAVPSWVGTAYGFLANLVLGAVLLVVFPRFSAGVASRATGSPLAAGGAGVLALVGVPLVLLVLAVTLVGLPLALLGGFGFVALVWAAVVYGQYAVGAWALGRAGVESRWLALVAGLLGFAVLGAVPFLGGLLELVALLLGLGALALGLRDAYRGRRGREAPGEGNRQATLGESVGESG